MVTKKQHYYPRCLLKHFANDNKKVFVYIRKGDKIELMNYEKICASNYTYESDDQVDNVLEHKLGKYESKIEPIIDNIINNYMKKIFQYQKKINKNYFSIYGCNVYVLMLEEFFLLIYLKTCFLIIKEKNL